MMFNLTTSIMRVFIESAQEQGIMAVAKHFAFNEQDCIAGIHSIQPMGIHYCLGVG